MVIPEEKLNEATGKAAYEAYCDFRFWKSFNGDPLPKWDEVQPEIKEGWIRAAIAAIGKRDVLRILR